MSKRILVIDDEKNIRLMLEQALGATGYEVTAAIDGEHGLTKVEQGHPDLVLLDMKMPGLDGIEVLRRLRKIAAEVPVIMITAHGTVETAVEAMKLGAIDYLRKPFSPEEIRLIVAKVLERQQLPTDRPADTVDGLLEQAKLLLSRRQFDAAEEFLHKVLSIDPTSAESLNLLGVYHELLGHLQEAVRFYRVALTYMPAYVPAQENIHRAATWPYDPKGVSRNLEPKSEPEE